MILNKYDIILYIIYNNIYLIFYIIYFIYIVFLKQKKKYILCCILH